MSGTNQQEQQNAVPKNSPPQNAPPQNPTPQANQPVARPGPNGDSDSESEDQPEAIKMAVVAAVGIFAGAAVGTAVGLNWGKGPNSREHLKKILKQVDTALQVVHRIRSDDPDLEHQPKFGQLKEALENEKANMEKLTRIKIQPFQFMSNSDLIQAKRWFDKIDAKSGQAGRDLEDAQKLLKDLSKARGL